MTAAISPVVMSLDVWGFLFALRVMVVGLQMRGYVSISISAQFTVVFRSNLHANCNHDNNDEISKA
jgi:hypothetical protein